MITIPIHGDWKAVALRLNENDPDHEVAPGLGVTWTISTVEGYDILRFTARAKGHEAYYDITGHRLTLIDLEEMVVLIREIEDILRDKLLSELTS